MPLACSFLCSYDIQIKNDDVDFAVGVGKGVDDEYGTI